MKKYLALIFLISIFVFNENLWGKVRESNMQVLAGLDFSSQKTGANEDKSFTGLVGGIKYPLKKPF
jgi:hypothetical protein